MKGALFTLMAILAAVQSVADVGQASRPPDDAAGSQSFTRPLCVYPKLAKYRGTGDARLAENFECR